MSLIELHRLMLKDEQRNIAYVQAIQKVIKPHHVVCDLGAGSGFLSILCAKQGAKRIYAIEAAQSAALYLKKIIQNNHCSSQIIVFTAPSYEVELPEKVDVIVSETFGSHPFEENAHEFLQDACARFLKKGGIVLPSRVQVYAAPASFEDYHRAWSLFKSPIHGCDLSAFHADAMRAMYAQQAKPDMLLAPGLCLEEVSLGHPRVPSQREMQQHFVVSRSGLLCGFIQWFSLFLTQDIQLSTAPDFPSTHWRQIFYCIDLPQKVFIGDEVFFYLTIDTRPQIGISVSWRIELMSAGRMRYQFNSQREIMTEIKPKNKKRGKKRRE